MMDDIMRGLAQRDFALHSCHFSVNLKSAISPDAFLQKCDKYAADWGQPGQRELMCIFRKQKSFTLVWDQNFTHTEGQVMGMLTVALKGGRYFADAFDLH